jgi:hypothetical protein
MEGGPSLDHLSAMTDDAGIMQHAVRDIPNRSTGYCTDDVARALMVALRAAEREGYRVEAMRLANIYLAFLLDAQLPDGRFRNFMSYDRRRLDAVGTPDSIGRAIWALGYAMRFAPRESWRKLCGEMLDRALPAVHDLTYSRSRAYAGIGLSHAYLARGRLDSAVAAALRAIVADFMRRHRSAGDERWDWFEDEMTYDNARLCEVLLRAGDALDDEQAMRLGMRTLRFYESVVFENGVFIPIGNDGWYVRGGKRARYDQQPLEAAAMVDAELFAASIATKVGENEEAHRRFAEQAAGWFHGRNTRGAEMALGGGCCDGLEEFRVNPNMGAESTLAYLWSAFAFEHAPELIEVSA